MPIEWTGSGPELPLPVDRHSGEPVRDQIERALREAIPTGRLSAGDLGAPPANYDAFSHEPGLHQENKGVRTSPRPPPRDERSPDERR